MALSEFENKRFEKPVKEYCAKKFPVYLKNELRLEYERKDQSIVLFIVRPMYNNPSKSIREMIAKTTYVKSKKIWKLYWQRADLKWHGYEPHPTVDTIEEFLDVVEEDKYGCFYG